MPEYRTFVVTNKVPPYPTRQFVQDIASKVVQMMGSFVDHSASTNDFAHGFSTNVATFQKDVDWIPNWTQTGLLSRIGGEYDEHATNWFRMEPEVQRTVVMAQMAWDATSAVWTTPRYWGSALPKVGGGVRAFVRPTGIYPEIVYAPGGTNAFEGMDVTVEGWALSEPYDNVLIETTETIGVSVGTNVMTVPFVQVESMTSDATQGANDGDTVYAQWSEPFGVWTRIHYVLSRYSRAAQLNLLYHMLNNMRMTHRHGGHRVGTYFDNVQEPRIATPTGTYDCAGNQYDALEETPSSNAYNLAWSDFTGDYASGFTNALAPDSHQFGHQLLYGYVLTFNCDGDDNVIDVLWQTVDIDSGIYHASDCDGAYLTAVRTNELAPHYQTNLADVVDMIEYVTGYVSSNAWTMESGNLHSYTNSAQGNHPYPAPYWGGLDANATNWVQFAYQSGAAVSPHSNAVVLADLYNQWGALPNLYQDVCTPGGSTAWADVTPFGGGGIFSVWLRESGALGLHTVTMWDFAYYDEDGETAD